jgi:predicted RNA-binding Zn ribbon-like protein
MRESLLQALETDIEVELTETEESREFNRILQSEGARAATAWRKSRLG